MLTQNGKKCFQNSEEDRTISDSTFSIYIYVNDKSFNVADKLICNGLYTCVVTPLLPSPLCSQKPEMF